MGFNSGFKGLSYVSQRTRHLRTYSHKICNLEERFSGEFGSNMRRLTGLDNILKRWYQTQLYLFVAVIPQFHPRHCRCKP